MMTDEKIEREKKVMSDPEMERQGEIAYATEKLEPKLEEIKKEVIESGELEKGSIREFLRHDLGQAIDDKGEILYHEKNIGDYVSRVFLGFPGDIAVAHLNEIEERVYSPINLGVLIGQNGEERN